MSTSAQLAANRHNATLSTGPRSEAGKSAVSRNAVAHGLSAAAVILTYEDRPAFEALLFGLASEFDPQTESENILVQHMAEARWRLARIRRIESASLESLLGSADPANADVRLAQALLAKGGDPLAKLERYAASAERSFFKARKELLASVAQRKQQETIAQSGRDDAFIESCRRPAVCKTKPKHRPTPVPELLDDDELELLTRPVTTGAA